MAQQPNTQPDTPLLYSQTPTDERGNFEYQGDLYCSTDDLPSLCRRIGQHLGEQFPDTRFAIRSERFSGGRKILAEVLDTPGDLTDREARQAFKVLVNDQMDRFGFCRSNLLSDYWNCFFFTQVLFGQSYWAALAARRGKANPVEALVSLATFKKRLKVGDRLTLLHSSFNHRFLGQSRAVIQVRSKDFVFEGPSYLDFPRAANFACDGRQVRIAIGGEDQPDAHLLYEWEPIAA